jgi:PAS domain S-box-containing protein
MVRKTFSADLRATLLLVFLGTLAMMTVFELVKQFLVPDITVWESHIITILFTSCLAVVIAYFTVQSLHEAHYRASKELGTRIATEKELQSACGQLTAQDAELRRQFYEVGKSRQALSESESEYRNILRTAMDGFCIVDTTGSFVDMNDAFCNMLGYSREEMLTLSLRSIEVDQTPEDIARHTEEITGKGEDRFETRYRCKDGRIIDIEVSAVFTGTRGGHLITFHRDITERKRADEALNRATRKLNILNFTTLADIRNAVFSLSAYLELEKIVPDNGKRPEYLQKQSGIVKAITDSLDFAKLYQSLGLKPAAWQNVRHSFLFAVSHLDLSQLSRKLTTGGLEIYADPLLENVFFALAGNVIAHGKTATAISLWYYESPEALVLIFEDNGQGIPSDMKEKIFERRYGNKTGMGLYLAREILSITGISIRETGTEGEGARFEIVVPKQAYRF